MEAPCPKCGELIVAPSPQSRVGRVPTSGVVRGVSGGGGFQSTAREREGLPSAVSGGNSSPSGRTKSRKVVPGGGPASDETQVMIKILVAVALVVFVVVLVTWFLKNQ